MEPALNRLRQDAVKCRDLAGSAITSEARDVLTGLAEQYERKLGAMEAVAALHRRPAFKWPLS